VSAKRIGVGVSVLAAVALGVWLLWPPEPARVAPARQVPPSSTPSETASPPPTAPAPAPANDATAAPMLAPSDRSKVAVTVVDDEASGVAGVVVRAALLDGEFEANDRLLEDTRSIVRGTTDASGAVALVLPKGKFQAFLKQDSIPRDLTGGFVEFEVEPPADASAEIRVTHMRGSLSVHVVDDLARPIEGIPVEIRHAYQRGDGKGVSGVDGLVTFDRLPPGQIVLTRKDLAREDRRFVETRYASERETRLTLAPGETRIVDLVVPRAGAIRLTTLPPLPDEATVSFVVRGNRGPADSYAKREDPTGPWPREVAGLPAGDYEIRPSFAAESDWGPIRAVISTTVRSGETTDVVVPIVELRGVLSGTVRDEHGDAVGEAYVSVVFGADDANKWVHTRNDGSFEIRGIPPAPVRVWVEPPVDRLRPAGSRELAYFGSGDDVALELPTPTRNVQLRLARGYRIRGVVRDAKTGRPLENHDVTIDHERNARSSGSTRTSQRSRDSEGGQFEFRHLRAGHYRLWAGHDAEVNVRVVEVDVGGSDEAPETVEITLVRDSP
jgi:hypothetical protein